MNKKGIDMTPAFAFGLILGIIAVVVGVSFLWAIFKNVSKIDEQDYFQELKEKIFSLKDGEESFLQYKHITGDLDKNSLVNSPVKSVIGFDKGQNSYSLRLEKGTWTFRDLDFKMTDSEIIIDYKRPNVCSEDSACICVCYVECDEKSICFNLEGIEKIEGPDFYRPLSFLQYKKVDDNPTFVIPAPEFTIMEKRYDRILLRIRRDGEAIFINS